MINRRTEFPVSFDRAVQARRGHVVSLLVIAAFLFLGAQTGCRKFAESESVSMYARAVSVREPRLLEIQAQVRGSQENLRYRWLSEEGKCDPQESREPVTIFHFADNADIDRITLSVWRDTKRVGESQLEVRVKNALVPPVSDVRIEIIDIPFAEAGGSETSTNIAGRVVGQIPKNCKILVYTRNEGVWYIQPLAFSKLEIASSGAWSTWCHKGSRYAAVLVHDDFIPLPTLDTIPRVRGEVLARTVVDGRSK